MADTDSGNLLSQIKDYVNNMDRTVDSGIVNKETGSSIGIRQNGDISIACNSSAQYKLQHDTGSAVEVSLQSSTITNRKNIIADEITVNKHKLNPKLIEYSDMRSVPLEGDRVIGDLTMTGTVLVRAWEPSINKYVLIRRQIRMPIFSPLLNIPDAPDTLGIDTDISSDLLANSSSSGGDQ